MAPALPLLHRLQRRTARYLGLLAAGLLSTMLARAEAPAPPQPVGLTLVPYTDASRENWPQTGPRPLDTAVWYPAAPGTQEADWRVAIFNAGRNAQGAPMAASPARLPLVLISHGTGGSAATMAWLAESLAAHGYLVAAVNHHGNTGYEPAARLEGFVVWWDRPRDLSAVLDRLLADPRFGPRIDPQRIGVAGFSIGGYTALATAGARISHAQWQQFCAGHATDSNCKLPPEAKFTAADLHDLLAHNTRVKAAIAESGASYQDRRIRSAFVISPALGPVLTQASLAAIHIPVRLMVGAQDDQTVPALNARAIAAAIPAARLDVLPGVTHYTFLPECNLVGRLVAGPFCKDPDGVDRHATHAQASAAALQFFDATLGTPAH
ncbi:MAG: alpha/beta hydrolase [Ramlibacter sp.]|nr:alpha/beta hydrolase [Ramlibacter sp.]